MAGTPQGPSGLFTAFVIVKATGLEIFKHRTMPFYAFWERLSGNCETDYFETLTKYMTKPHQNKAHMCLF